MPKQSSKIKNKEKVTHVHPNSRKAERAISDAHRNEKVKKRKREKHLKTNLIFNKLVWFKNNLPDDSQYFSIDQVHNLIEKYLTRHDEGQTLSELSLSIVGDKHCFRDEVKRMALIQEIDEYKGCGINIPDLTSKKNVSLIRSWTGESNLMPSIRLISVKLSDGRRVGQSNTTQRNSNTIESVDVMDCSS